MSDIRGRSSIHPTIGTTERPQKLTHSKSSKEVRNSVETDGEYEENHSANTRGTGVENELAGSEEEDNNTNNEIDQLTFKSDDGDDNDDDDDYSTSYEERQTQKPLKQCIRNDTLLPKTTTFKSSEPTTSTPVVSKKKNYFTNENTSTTYCNTNYYRKMLGPILLLIIIVTIAIAVMPYQSKESCSFMELQRRYPKQSKHLWKSLTIGIDNIIHKRTPTPAVFLLVNDNSGGDENINALVKDIAKQSAACFDPKTLPVELNSEDFTSPQAIDSYGFIIEKFKMKIKASNVIVIANLNQIPAESARALHTICDTHSPITNEVVIFLTLVIPATNETPVKKAEDALNNLWGAKLSSNELDPLIVRITDQVIAIKN